MGIDILVDTVDQLPVGGREKEARNDQKYKRGSRKCRAYEVGRQCKSLTLLSSKNKSTMSLAQTRLGHGTRKLLTRV